MALVTLVGAELADLEVPDPAASVRLLVAEPGADLVVPAWTGNEFLLPGGARPSIRTFTPLRPVGDDVPADRLDLAIVLHGGGVVSRWAQQAAPGDEVAVSGPGRGYRVDVDAPAYLVAGDESALPAVGQVLAALPPAMPVQAHLETVDGEPGMALPARPGATVTWHRAAVGSPPGDALVAAVRSADLVPGTRTWVAGEAAAVQRVRRHLFEERGLGRATATVRGYWKHGRAGDDDADGGQ
jgi:NADPH-dependent ferric siderophore reductase